MYHLLCVLFVHFLGQLWYVWVTWSFNTRCDGQTSSGPDHVPQAVRHCHWSAMWEVWWKVCDLRLLCDLVHLKLSAIQNAKDMIVTDCNFIWYYCQIKVGDMPDLFLAMDGIKTTDIEGIRGSVLSGRQPIALTPVVLAFQNPRSERNKELFDFRK